MSVHVVVGSGATGSATARLLAEAGEQVRVISRSGTGPQHPRIELAATDAGDVDRLTELARGATVLFNCAMPRYDRWITEFPPLAVSLLTAAGRVGADYVMLGNTYGYGPIDGRVTEDLPMRPSSEKGKVRAQMWLDALAAHEAGHVRVTEVRASDFVGAGTLSPFTLMVGAQVLDETPVRYPGDLDAPHSWTYSVDAACTLIAAAAHEDSWGRAWHVPSTSEAPVRQLASQLAERAGLPAPRLGRMPLAELEETGRADSIMAEFPEMLYLYDRPALLDSVATEQALGVTPSSLEVVIAEMVADRARAQHAGTA